MGDAVEVKEPPLGAAITFGPGETIVGQGDQSRRMFVIESGTAEVWRLAKGGGRWKLSDLGPGDLAGETEAVDGEPALATVQAIEPVTCRPIAHDDVLTALNALDPIYASVARRMARMLRENHQVYTEGVTLSLFGGGAVSALANAGDEMVFDEGEALMRQGEAPDAMYVLLSGLVEVSREEDGETRKLVELSRGCLVGEVEMIDLIPRNATVTALKSTKARRVAADSFREGLEQLGIVKDAMISMAHALRRSNEILAKPARP